MGETDHSQEVSEVRAGVCGVAASLISKSFKTYFLNQLSAINIRILHKLTYYVQKFERHWLIHMKDFCICAAYASIKI